MAAYVIVDTLLEDPAAYEDYKVQARPLVERFGGEYLARGGAMVVRESDLWSPSRLVVIRFADVASATRCLDSPEYQRILPISQGAARRTMVIVEGL